MRPPGTNLEGATWRVPHGAGACPVQIGARERGLRRRAGWLALGAGCALGVWLVAMGTPPWVRLAVALPFFAGMVGVLQAREGT